MKKQLFAMAAFLCMTVAGMAQMPQGAGQGQGRGERPQAPQLTEEQKAEQIQTRVNEVSEDAGGLDEATKGKVKDLYTKYFDVLSKGKPSLPSTGGGMGGGRPGGGGGMPAGGAGGGGGDFGGGGGGGAMMGGGGMRGGGAGGGNSEMLERIRTQIKEYNDAKKEFDNGLKEMMTKDQFKAYQKGDKAREKEREKNRASQFPGGGMGQRPGAAGAN